MEIEFAHIKALNTGGFEFQELVQHLLNTAELSSKFSKEFDNSVWGYLIGLWHDLGKYSDDFQEYIRVNSGYEEDDQKRPKTDHTSAGAILAKEILQGLWPPVAYCIAGHHAGLLNWLPDIGVSGDLSHRLGKHEYLDKIRSKISDEVLRKRALNTPAGKTIDPQQIHLWIRILFSCLVDADFLDTESFMNPEASARRGNYQPINILSEAFTKHMAKLATDAKPTEINKIRKRILQECIVAGKLEPGFFSITVPTGGGKTLSSMAWALEHAIKHNKRRIIFAIPYTSIIAQTAEVYRNIFGDENVIEHHSNLDEDIDSQDRKLASENWDAPIIVTTNVQLFESLYANKTSRCRKLHNLANSIIILDEAQMLPPEYLKPILSVLKGLVEYFGVSVMFSTATQPALTGRIGGSGRYSFEGIPHEKVREVVNDISSLSKELERVKIEMPENINETKSWESVAFELEQHEQILCVVNTRRQCRELYKLIPEGTIHLSRLMCSAHIMDCIRLIKSRLKDDQPVRVVSTQLIEAGVDIDFPVVYRALAGLDSIAQCAGRCNREGSMNKSGNLGTAKVFIPEKATPGGLIRKGADMTKELITLKNGQAVSWLEPETFNAYFKGIYSRIENFDKADIKGNLWDDAMRMHFQFATASRNFRLIDDKGSKSILVEYDKGVDLIQLLKRKGPEPWLMRKLQMYSVSVNERDFNELIKAGMIEQIHGCWIQVYQGLYDKTAGLLLNGEWLEEINII